MCGGQQIGVCWGGRCRWSGEVPVKKSDRCVESVDTRTFDNIHRIDTEIGRLDEGSIHGELASLGA